MLRRVRGAAAMTVGVACCLLLTARPAEAQIFRAFVGQGFETCGTVPGGPTGVIAGASMGSYTNTFVDFEIGGLVNRCRDAQIGFIGLHLFPVAEVLDHRLWVGGALNVDLDFAEMNRSTNGTGTAYMFVRPEFAVRVRLFDIGQTRENSRGGLTPDGIFSLETHIGLLRAKYPYVTIGMAMHLNR